MNQDTLQVDVPVGEPCIGCDQRIVATDAGFVIPYVGPTDDPREVVHWHRICFLKDLGLLE